MNRKVLVVIPTYNEAENISNTLDLVLKQGDEFDVLVVDDGSPDGTAKLVREKMKEVGSGKINLLERGKKLGLGRAYIDGFKWGLERGYDYLQEMDADLSHDPNDLPRFLSELESGADVVVGSRYLNGISVIHWDLKRLIMSMFGNWYARFFTGLKLTDLTGGFNAFRRKVLESIDLDTVSSDGYAFQIEIKYRAYLKGFKIKEIPIIFYDRVNGESKMSFKIVLEAVKMCPYLRLIKIFGKV